MTYPSAPDSGLPVPAPQPVSNSNKRVFIIGAAVIAVIALALIAVFTLRDTSPKTFEMKGSVGIIDGVTKLSDNRCAGKGGYKDLSEGASVTIGDQSGKTVATGSIASSEYVSGACMLTFSIQVPAKLDFYQVEVSHRGVVTYSNEEARSGPFMSIGG
ncbi:MULTISPECIES: hypothetical protein [Rhodococcus]|nr:MULTISPECIES: hypothetical protein [Rhodococcus]MCD2105291.1 hypothetical protein [Rhodococcus qingshengii]MCZ4524106.1 hypothetical protein [Rhodococcus erythropolis]MDI9905624.1 hypothetical protein [Rhodococcus sp. IEGM 1406]